MFFRGPAQLALGRPQDRFSEAGPCASCSCASCVLQGAARPPSLAEFMARAKRERVVQDGVEKANRRHGTTDTAPLAPYLKFDNF